MKAIQSILDAYAAGHQTLLISGRSLEDTHVNAAGLICPLRHTLIRELHARHQMVTLQFNLAFGARFQTSILAPDADAAVRQALQENARPLLDAVRMTMDQTLLPYDRSFRFFSAVMNALEENHKPRVPLFVLADFGEDLVPSADSGGANDFIIQASEALRLLASDFQKRRHPFLFALSSQFGERVDRRVRDAFHTLEITQPDAAEKRVFVQALRASPTCQAAMLEPGLDDAVVANLTSKTPNNGLEQIFLASARTGVEITSSRLIERKRRDVISMSEGTLSLLDTGRTAGLKLAGRTIRRPLHLLEKLAALLKAANTDMPVAVLLAGAPATAKTDLALLVAAQAGVPAYSLNSPKGSLVGQTEARARLMFRTFKELSPCLAFVDEITEAFPMSRNIHNLDSGASDAVLGEMQTALSDKSLAGRGLLIATTNCPWKVGAAMASRFLYVPVLSPPEEDYPDILAAVCESLGAAVSAEWQAAIHQAAGVFYQKGATPRTMRTLLSSKASLAGERLNPELVLRAAASCNQASQRDRASAEYADLSAIDVCTDLELLPWHDAPDYPLPSYLKSLVAADGSVDKEGLQRRMAELKPLVNV